MFVIYKITNIKNGKIYIGQTMKSINERFARHIYDAFHSLDTKFSRAIRKYGKESFICEQIDVAKEKQEANNKEKDWIDNLHSTDYTIGYNSTTGGDGGNTYQNKTKSEMKKISKKISKGLSGKNNGKHTEIYVKNIETDEVKHYDCMEDFCKEIGCDHGIVSHRLKFAKKYGIQETIFKKYIVSDTTIFSRYSTYNHKCGEIPFKVTDLTNNEIFYGLNKRECVEYFGLKTKRQLESKRFLVEPMKE